MALEVEYVSLSTVSTVKTFLAKEASPSTLLPNNLWILFNASWAPFPKEK